MVTDRKFDTCSFVMNFSISKHTVAREIHRICAISLPIFPPATSAEFQSRDQMPLLSCLEITGHKCHVQPSQRQRKLPANGPIFELRKLCLPR